MASPQNSSSNAASAIPRKRRWPWVAGALTLALVLFIVIFDWNWFRGPLERYLGESTGRPVRIGHLDVELALPPRVIISDLSVGNAEWAGKAPLAALRELMFSVSVPSLFTNNIMSASEVTAIQANISAFFPMLKY